MKANRSNEKSIVNEGRRLSRHASRSRVMGREATLSLEEWIATLDLFNWSCAYCGGPFEIMEHLIPDYYGGGTTRENCYPACRSCNQQKANIDPREGYMAAPKPFNRQMSHETKMGMDRGPVPVTKATPLILELRHRQGVRTQREFAQCLGISESMLSRLYLGSRRPGVEVLRRIEQAFPDLKPQVLACI